MSLAGLRQTILTKTNLLQWTIFLQANLQWITGATNINFTKTYFFLTDDWKEAAWTWMAESKKTQGNWKEAEEKLRRDKWKLQVQKQYQM